MLALLPALQRPTISPLSDADWVAVNTIIEERTVRDLIPAAQERAGAGHRRVSAEQDRDVMAIRDPRSRRIGDDRSVRSTELLVAAYSHATARLVERRVARIVDRVKRDGDRAVTAITRSGSTGSTGRSKSAAPRCDAAARARAA